MYLCCVRLYFQIQELNKTQRVCMSQLKMRLMYRRQVRLNCEWLEGPSFYLIFLRTPYCDISCVTQVHTLTGGVQENTWNTVHKNTRMSVVQTVGSLTRVSATLLSPGSTSFMNILFAYNFSPHFPLVANCYRCILLLS